MTIPEQLALIVKLAQAEVKCTCACHLKVVLHKDSGCPDCGSTGKTPDPRFKGLVGALTEKCPCSSHARCSCCQEMQRHQLTGPFRCEICDGTGRVLCTEWQQGELAGVLSYHARGLTDIEGKRLSLHLMGVFGTLDPDAVAAQWWLEYLEALEKVKEEAHVTE